MNDFLGGLIARNLGLAEVLRPRPVSRFEPRGQAPALALRGRATLSTVEREPSPDNELPWDDGMAVDVAPQPDARHQALPRRRSPQAPAMLRVPDAPAVKPPQRSSRRASTRSGQTHTSPHGIEATGAAPQASMPLTVTSTLPTETQRTEATMMSGSFAVLPVETSPTEVRRTQPSQALTLSQPERGTEELRTANRPSSVSAVATHTTASRSPLHHHSNSRVAVRNADSIGIEPGLEPDPDLTRMPAIAPVRPTPEPGQTNERWAAYGASGREEELPRGAPVATAVINRSGLLDMPHLATTDVAVHVFAPPGAPSAHDDDDRRPARAQVIQPLVRAVDPDVRRPTSASPRAGQTPVPLAGEPPPTIQVTIGRIEVRAMPPPASPTQSRRASPIMTLEEYLRQRSHGGRR
jgi:hypothetical protein